MYFVVQKIIRTFANGMGMKRILFLHGFYASGQCVPAKAISEKTSEKFTVTDRTIESDLAHLKKIGILTREGGRKDGKWVIVIENKEAT
jgi:Fic family protein